MSRDSTLMMPATLALDTHRAAAVTVGVVVLTILAVFGDTAGSIVRIWLSSDTFSHGFVVVPVSLWLIWRRRAELGTLPVRPFLPALPLLAIAGACWLIGRLANANVVEHFALLLMIQSALVVTLGWALVRAVAFPVLFLFFAVPFGEAFVPLMIDWTADFTVLALKATGIPVYREGNNFAVPTGHWSVAEACSGIRYLIASVMAGTLFSYVMYSGFWRRAAFIAISIAVPIVANWLRAYLIVLLGHLSGNELASGVDHVIYGWVFFGVVLFIMFAVGARFRSSESGHDADGAQLDAIRARPGDATRTALVIAGVATLSLALPWSALGGALMTQGSDRPRVLDPIADANGWNTVAGPSEFWQPGFAGERVARRQIFEREGQRVAVYIAYYSGQSSERKVVSASNVLLTPAPESRWREIATGDTEIAWRHVPFTARLSTIAGSGGRFDVVWWYWIDGRVTGSDATAKAWIARSRLRLRGDDAAAVFLSTPPADRSDGGTVAARFVEDMSESISRVLVAARDGGLGPTARGPTQ